MCIRDRSGMTTGQYKRLKGLTKENLRDNMTDLELVLTMLAEASTTDISKTAKPQTFEENKQVAKRGGKVAGIARQALEAETGKPDVYKRQAVTGHAERQQSGPPLDTVCCAGRNHAGAGPRDWPAACR